MSPPRTPGPTTGSLSPNDSSDLGQGGSGRHQHGLFPSIDIISLRVMEKGWNSEWDVSPVESFESLGCAKKGSLIPITVLKRLWKVPENVSRKILGRLSSLSLVRRIVQKKVVFVQIHDLVHDYCQELARKHNTLLRWNKNVVNGYMESSAESSNDEASPAEELQEWWVNTNDCYIVDNIVHHMVGANLMYETFELLSDYRWILRTFQEYERTSLEPVVRDLKLALKSLKQSNLQKDAKKLLKKEAEFLLEAINLCVFEDPERIPEYAFQLFGRLLGSRSPLGIISRLVWSINAYAPRPWVRPVPGCLTRAGGRVRKEMNLGLMVKRDKLLCMSVREDLDEIIAGFLDGLVIVFSFATGEKRHELSGHSVAVRNIEVNEMNGEIVTSSMDGTVRVWKDGHNVLRSEKLGEYAQGTIIPHSRFIVCSSNNGFRVLNAENNQMSDNMVSGTFWAPIVQASKMGDFFIFASKNKVSRWDLAQGTQSFRKRWESDVGAAVCSAAIGENDEVLVLGSFDKSILFLSCRDGRPSCRGRIHSPDEQVNYWTSVHLSADGKCLVGLSQQSWKIGQVHVWKIEKKSVHLEERWDFYGDEVYVSEDFGSVYGFSRSETFIVWRTSGDRLRSEQAHPDDRHDSQIDRFSQ